MGCNSESLLERSTLKSDVGVVYYDKSFDEFLQLVDRAKEMLINDMVLDVSDTVTSFIKHCKTFFYSKIDLKARKLEDLDFKNWAISEESPSVPKKFKLMPKNKKEIDDLANFDKLKKVLEDSFKLTIRSEILENLCRPLNPPNGARRP